jgi:hypothetical protein
MLYWFTGAAPGYQAWLASHPDAFVVTADQVVRLQNIPMRADGSFDMKAGPQIHRTLHRGSCAAVQALGHDGTKICGPRQELEDSCREEDVRTCPLCL